MLLVEGDPESYCVQIKVYIAIEVCREGWFVLSANTHNMVHLLRTYHVNVPPPELLTLHQSCEFNCEHRDDYLMLVPRVRPLTIDGTKFWRVSPYGKILCRELKKMLNKDREDYYYHFYFNEENYDGTYLMAGFCPQKRMHWAIALKKNKPLLILEREED